MNRFLKISFLLTLLISTICCFVPVQAVIVDTKITEIDKTNEEDFYVSLSNGAIFKLRPVLYFIENGDYPRYYVPNYYLARKEFASMQDLFSSVGLKTKQVFAFEKEHKCQILFPSNEKRPGPFFATHLWAPHAYIKFHDYWCWNSLHFNEKWYLHANYKNIPLNFHDTSVNLGPLRANLFEHASSNYFYAEIGIPYAGNEYGSDLSRGHLIEAEMIEFHDHIQNIDQDTLKLGSTKINVLLIQPASLEEWAKGDEVHVIYQDQGMYIINNLSKACNPIHAYLADDTYSDLRNHPIFDEIGFR